MVEKESEGASGRDMRRAVTEIGRKRRREREGGREGGRRERVFMT